jgi:hypothetical protein
MPAWLYSCGIVLLKLLKILFLAYMKKASSGVWQDFVDLRPENNTFFEYDLSKNFILSSIEDIKV